MTLRFISGFAAVAFAVSGLSVPAALAKPVSGAGAVKMIDTDNDGTVDLKEVEAVASATFDRLEKDGDGTLDAKELNSKAGKALLALIK